MRAIAMPPVVFTASASAAAGRALARDTVTRVPSGNHVDA
jgi:hypothetical protein